MAAVLVAVGLFVYSRVGSDLNSALNTSLRTRADDLAATATRPGSIEPHQDRLVARDESLAQVIGPGGRVQYSSAGVGRAPVLSGEELARARRGPVFADRNGVAHFDERLRLLARPAGNRVVIVGATREDREEALGSLKEVLLIGLPIALVLSALAAYGVATAALRPVSAMRASFIAPPDTETVAATAASAKSPARRATSSKPQPVCGGNFGTWISVSSSSSARSTMSASRKNPRALRVRMPLSETM